MFEIEPISTAANNDSEIINLNAYANEAAEKLGVSFCFAGVYEDGNSKIVSTTFVPSKNVLKQEQLRLFFSGNDEWADSNDITDPLHLAENTVADNGVKYFALQKLKLSGASGFICVVHEEAVFFSPEKKMLMKLLGEKMLGGYLIQHFRRQWENCNRLQKRLVSVLAHDVRNPFASIKSVFDLKQEGIINGEEADEMFSMASKQVEAAIKMLANVIDFSNLHIKSGTQSRPSANARTVAEKLIEHFQTTALEKKIIFINKVLPVNIPYSDSTLRFILETLIDNAVKFTEEGIINIQFEETNNHYLFTIWDTGTGIDEWTLSRLFNSGKNYSVPGTRNEHGSGLGLILLKEFLLLINGSIKIVSPNQTGTTAIVQLSKKITS